MDMPDDDLHAFAIHLILILEVFTSLFPPDTLALILSF